VVSAGTSGKRRGIALLVVLVAANAVLYSCVLPLWEGFDEPAHYSYVQSLSIDRRLPVLNRTACSREVRESLKLVPVSWLLHNALPKSISFEEWFQLSPEERRARWAAVGGLSPALQGEPSDLLNYEAQQAPLAYLMIAPIDALISRMRLRSRVLTLRLILTVLSAMALLGASNLLLHALAVDGVFRLGALACTFECQMLWASVAHVSNDCLAVPLSTVLLALLILMMQAPKPRYVFGAAGAMAAGLLTKAYFLAFVPVFVAALVMTLTKRRISGRTTVVSLGVLLLATPWYARNVLLYGSLSGTQESIAGVGFSHAVAALRHINWIDGTVELFRSGLWTGNWSFVSFSRLTLDIEMALITSAFVLLLWSAREARKGEWWAIAGCAAFFLGLIYQTGVTWVATQGRSQHAEPWYAQAILPCIWAIVFGSFKRQGKTGRVLAGALLAVAAWVAAATYLWKLIPLYGGFAGRSTAGAMWAWWRHAKLEILSSTVAGPLFMIFCALAVFVAALFALNGIMLRELWRGEDGGRKIPL